MREYAMVPIVFTMSYFFRCTFCQRNHHPQCPSDADFSVVSNPEFLRDRSAIQDFKHPDRIVVGTDDDRAKAVDGRTLTPALSQCGANPLRQPANCGTGQICANAFLATKITFINEIADLCEKVGAEVQDVARAMGLDNRIGSKFLHAGRVSRVVFSQGCRRAHQDRARQ